MASFRAGQENLLRVRGLVLGISVAHALEDRAVQHHAPSPVCAHDHPARLLPVGPGADVDLEGPDTTFLPLLAEVEQLGLAGEDRFFFFLAGFDCSACSLVGSKTHEQGERVRTGSLEETAIGLLGHERVGLLLVFAALLFVLRLLGTEGLGFRAECSRGVRRRKAGQATRLRGPQKPTPNSRESTSQDTETRAPGGRTETRQARGGLENRRGGRPEGSKRGACRRVGECARPKRLK